MRYYSEDTVKGILEQIDSHYVKELEDYDHIEIPDKHGRLIDADALGIKDEWALVETSRIWDAPTVLEVSEVEND